MKDSELLSEPPQSVTMAVGLSLDVASTLKSKLTVTSINETWVVKARGSREEPTSLSLKSGAIELNATLQI